MPEVRAGGKDQGGGSPLHDVQRADGGDGAEGGGGGQDGRRWRVTKKKLGEEPGFVKQVDFARRLLKFIQDGAPRGGDGVLCGPYWRWADGLESDIKAAENWLKAQGQEPRGNWGPDGT